MHVLFFGNDPPATLGVALRAGKQNPIFIHFVCSVSVMWSLGFKKEWEKWNQGSIVYGQWVQVKTLTGATRETLDDFNGVTLRFCV